MNEPQVPGQQIGRFEWYIETYPGVHETGEVNALIIQCLEYDPECYPQLVFEKGWGLASDEVSENEIELVFAFQTLVFEISSMSEEFCNSLCNATFLSALGRAKKFRSGIGKLMAVRLLELQ